MYPHWMGFQPMMPMMMQGGVPRPANMQAGMPASTSTALGIPPSMAGLASSASSMPRLTADIPFAESGKTEEEKQRAVVVKALKEIADTEKTKEKPKEEEAEKKPSKEEPEKKPSKCFLHSKPNKNCKKCQAALSANSVKESPEEKQRESLDADEVIRRNQNKSAETEKKNLQCSPMLKEQIVKSSYFKSLLDITTVDGLIQEIVQYVDTLDVYNPGSKTSPSCFMCHVFRLSVLAHIDNELGLLIDNRDYAVVRCVGFLYTRFVTAPSELWDVLEEYLLDDMELIYNQDGNEITTTIGEYVEALLVQDKYFDSPLPRLPVKVRQMVEEKAAPMLQHRKRLQANRDAITPDNVDGTAVEVCMDGTWLRGTAKELAGSVPSRVKVKVRLEGGVDVKVHLGKVVISDWRSDRADDGSDDDRWGRRRRSRSRSRGRGGYGGGRRGGSPDWSRYKGKSDAEMIQELRERARANAVCGHGKVYAKRPLNFDAQMASTALANPAGRVEYPDEASSSSRRRRRSAEEEAAEQEAARRKRLEEDDRQRRLAGVYKKYCATPTASQGSAYKEVDTPDVLRLG